MPNSSVIKHQSLKVPNLELAPVMSQIQENFRSLSVKEIIDGQILPDIAIFATGTFAQIPHKLNRPINGYIIIKKSGNANIWDNELNGTHDKNNFLTLQTSLNTVISIWVF